MRVLVVQDDAVSAMIVVKRSEVLGHTCEVVRDGDEAWRLLTQPNEIDVVISGFYAPGMPGTTLCQQLRDRGERYQPFIFLTAADDRESQLAGMRAGADDYLLKPVDLHELHLRLIAAERLVRLHRRLEAQADELRRLNHKLYDQGRLDPVTGVPNRLRLEEDADSLYADAEQLGLGYSLAMLDVDRFKSYNDRYGHRAGDEALRRIAAAIMASSRARDQVYRYGGEEFVLLLQTDRKDAAMRVCERVRRAVKALRIPHPDSEHGVVTVSAGFATMSPNTPRPVTEIIDRADAAMYDAKRSGRNRVVAYDPELHAESFEPSAPASDEVPT